MSSKKTEYFAKKVDNNGLVHYSEEENSVWCALISRQLSIVQGCACDEFMHGLQCLQLPMDRVPQYHEINRNLMLSTGWVIESMPALIPDNYFFWLLSQRKFPAANFIRRRDEMDYLQEPDIFHEIFGHCPMLTNIAYADFSQNYGKMALSANAEDQKMLARLYWFTIEFGLIKTSAGLRAYGGGILSSASETIYCIESNKPIRKPFNLLDVLRTPYRIDIMQPIYFVIDNLSELFAILEQDIFALIRAARCLGLHCPVY